MNKQEFFKILRKKLYAFDVSEVDTIIGYYNEMIEDKKDTGMSEEEAIASLGEINKLVTQISADLVVTRSDEQRKPLSNIWIILGICASPILLPIGIVFVAVTFTVFIVMISLLLAFSATGIGLLIGLVPMLIFMIQSGVDFGVILVQLGGIMCASGVMILLVYYIVKIGRIMLHHSNKWFSRVIKKRSKGVS